MTRHLKHILPAALLLLALSFSTLAQVQSNVNLNQNNFEINPLLGAPTVTITSATMNPGLGALVKWSVVKPTLTQLIDFDVAVHATYQNGKSGDGKQTNVAGNLREILVSVPGSTFPVASLKTTIIAKFHTQTTLTDTQTFNLTATGGGSTPRPPGNPIEITAATKLAQCDAGKDCFEVKWSVNTNRPSIVSFNAFAVKLDVGYSNGQTVSGNTNATAAQRQVIIKVNKPSQGTPATANVTLNAVTTISGLVSTVK